MASDAPTVLAGPDRQILVTLAPADPATGDVERIDLADRRYPYEAWSLPWPAKQSASCWNGGDAGG